MDSLLTSSASCPISVVDCGTPMLPPGGQAIPAPNTTTFGSTFSFDCDYLHDVLGSNNLGTNIITCAGDSYWTFFSISCIGQLSSSVRKEKQNHAVFVCTHVHMHICMRAYACRQRNTQAQTCAHAHTHTHTLTLSLSLSNTHTHHSHSHICAPCISLR